MDGKQTYCKSWFRAKKRPTELWTAERARSAHETGAFYAVVIGPPDRPTHFIEVNTATDLFGVGFLDEERREYLSYSFTGVDAERVFLATAIHRQYERGLDLPENGSTYDFNPAGEVTIKCQTFRPTAELEVARGYFDPARNYEPRPQFGSYGSLVALERAAWPIRSV